MGHWSYNKVGNGATRSCRGIYRGLKLNPKRFSVHRLCPRFVYFFNLLRRWRCSSYGQAALKLLEKCLARRNSIKRNNSRSSSTSKSLGKAEYCRLRSLGVGGSNSFYAEAIADCLEFIRQSSVSID